MKTHTRNLRIKDVKHLARLLRTNPDELCTLCGKISSSPDRYYLQWLKETKKGKIRPMVKIHGRLREILDELKHLLQAIELPSYIHGGVPGRSTHTNAEPHLRRPTVVRIDLENHFPSTSHRKVYAMFRNQQQCSPDVARILTRLTTLNGGLPQGSPTSTVISNLVTLHLSNRLYSFARSRGSQCTQYVDDYTFSGNRRLARHNERIASIVTQAGFRANPKKTVTMPADGEQVTTGIRVNGKRPDIPRSNLKDIRDDLNSLAQHIASGKNPSEKAIRRIEGRIRYVHRLNRGAAKRLKRKLDHFTRRATTSFNACSPSLYKSPPISHG